MFSLLYFAGWMGIIWVGQYTRNHWYIIYRYQIRLNFSWRKGNRDCEIKHFCVEKINFVFRNIIRHLIRNFVFESHRVEWHRSFSLNPLKWSRLIQMCVCARVITLLKIILRITIVRLRGCNFARKRKHRVARTSVEYRNEHERSLWHSTR